MFESGAILLYLAEKFGALLPADPAARTECLSWLFWQMGSAPYLGGGFGHFYAYAPEKLEYPIDRFAMEAKRQLDVLDRRLAETRTWAATNTASPTSPPGPGTGCWRWASCTTPATFLQVDEYTHVQRWATQIAERPAVSAAAWSTAPGAIRPGSCTSAMTPAISTGARRTSSTQRRPAERSATPARAVAGPAPAL